MTPYYSESGIEIYHGDCREVMASLNAERFSTVVTDPPYELGFMGKSWDRTGVAFAPETWKSVARVCKPGAMLMAFGGTRTFHRLTCAIEDAGWEIRDCMMWLYGSGFPKSSDISKAIDKAAGVEREMGPKKVSANSTIRHDRSGVRNDGYERPWRNDPAAIERNTRESYPSTEPAKEWNGWGTALKPSWEPIVIAMKPLDGTFAENAQQYGVAGFNIEGGRIETSDNLNGGAYSANRKPSTSDWIKQGGTIHSSTGTTYTQPKGRWPANIIFDETAAAELDKQTGILESGKPSGTKSGGKLNCYGTFSGGIPVTGFGDIGGASRFFYTAKASKSDRGHGNTHPTVKPIDLMKYLCKLTASPTGGEILDPFGGSMTTLIAAREYGRPAVAIELDVENCKIGIERMSQQLLFGGVA